MKGKKSKKHGLTSDDEDYLLQKIGYSQRFLKSLPNLEELESKLDAYYALEKEAKRSESESPKRSVMNSSSLTREQKTRQAGAQAAAASEAPKWKMQIGQATAGSSRFKKKAEREE